MSTPVIEYVDPRSLRPHPNQVRVYGATGGEHDATFPDLSGSIGKHGVREPIRASRGTPGLPDGTIISGHRRRDGAVLQRVERVPVIFETHESAAHAAEAHIEANRQRVKDEWTKTREAEVFREVEGDLAEARRLKGNAAGGRGGKSVELVPPTDAGKTRDAVAARLGESGKTTDLRFKLAEKAREQNPEHPEDSPVARDLKANKPVKTVARDHGVIKDPRRTALLGLVKRAMDATTTTALDAARAAADAHRPALSKDEWDEFDGAYFDTKRAIEKRTGEKTPDPVAPPAAPAPVAPPPKMPDLFAGMNDALWSRKVNALVDQFLVEWDALTDARASATVKEPTARTAYESAATRVLEAMLAVLPEDARPEAPRRLSVIKGGQ